MPCSDRKGADVDLTITIRLKDIYFHELFFQATIIRDTCEQIFADTPTTNDKGEPVFHLLPAIHGKIGLVLSAAANIKKLLTGDRERGKDEKPERRRLRLARTAMLWEALAPLTLSEMLDTKVRNSLEHFDEYLDDENLRL